MGRNTQSNHTASVYDYENNIWTSVSADFIPHGYLVSTYVGEYNSIPNQCDISANSTIAGSIVSPEENSTYTQGQFIVFNWIYDGPGQCHLFLYNNNWLFYTIETN